MDKALKNKDVAKELLLLAQRTHNTATITFYLQDHKKPAQYIWEQYVKDEQINLSYAPDLQEAWQNAANQGLLEDNRDALVDGLRERAKIDLQQDLCVKIVRDPVARKNLGFVPKDAIDALRISTSGS